MSNSLGCNRQGAPSISQMIKPALYSHRSFASLIDLLVKLKVVGIRQHKISHALTMITSTPPVPKSWIPLSVVSLYQEYVELVPYRGRDV